MFECSFELNGEPLSDFKCGAKSFPAFSGLGEHVNKKTSSCIKGKGPIPAGKYYIFDRQSGGLLGPLRDLFNDHDTWFALHAIDKKIDDVTFCNEVKRGAFRLHPKSGLGLSQGCITIDSQKDFLFLRTILRNRPQQPVAGSNLMTYGMVTVK